MEDSVTQASKVATDAREADLGRILEESLNEIYIFDAESLRFLEVNRGGRQNLGYTMEELRGLTPLDLKPEFTAKSFEKLVQPLQRGDRRKVQFETVHRRKNGSLYPIEAHLQLSTFDGYPAFFAIILDTTERTRFETALKESEELHRITLQSISDAVFVTDDSGNLRFVCPNVDVIFGYSESEVVAMGKIAKLLEDDIVEARELEECSEISNVQRSILDKFGGQHDLLINVKRVAIRGGTRLYTCRDVTRLKAAQDRLVQAERLAAIGQMVTVVAHESGNTIQRIQTNTELLRFDLDEHENQLPALSKIEIACKELGSLLEELRNYASPIKLNHSECCLSEIFDEAWNNLEAEWRSRDAGLDVDSALSGIWCRADRHRMVQVFRNLFENSLAACCDPLRIKIGCPDNRQINDSRTLHISVRDNGPGLTAEQKQKIFEPFFTTKSKGTGLGMAIARRIMEAHDGTIDVAEGDCDCAGAEFVIALSR